MYLSEIFGKVVFVRVRAVVICQGYAQKEVISPQVSLSAECFNRSEKDMVGNNVSFRHQAHKLV